MKRRTFIGLLVGASLAVQAAPDGVRGLARTVVCPGDADYDRARRLINPALVPLKPSAVIYCETTTDLQRSIAWARKQSVPFVVRSGGHSNAGYSSCDGLILDLSRMQRIEVDAQTAVVGPGCRLMALSDHLWAKRLALPVGTCGTVGIGGLTLGGGFGITSRQFGLTCDNLLEVELVSAAGEVLVCNAETHPDLFWACRGGGGGNFGVATSFKFQLHAVDAVSYYELEWPWTDAADVLEAWQAWAPDASDELFSICAAYACGLDASGHRTPPVISSRGAYLGPPDKLEALLGPILARTPSKKVVGTESHQQAMRRWTNSPSPDPSWTKSHFVRTALDPAIAIHHLELRSQSARMTFYGGIELSAFGGAIRRVAGEATAFPHRDARFLCLYETNWGHRDAPQVRTDNINWLRALHQDMQACASGTYANFTEADEPDWQTAYYGANYPRLLQIKQKYDPDNVFRFQQSVRP